MTECVVLTSTPPTGGVSPFSPDVIDPQRELAGPDGKVGTADDPITPTPLGPARLHAVTVDRLPASTWGNSRWGARLAAVLSEDYTVQGWFFRTFNQQPAPLLVTPGAIELALAGKLAPTLTDDRGFRVADCIGVSRTSAFGRTPSGRVCSRSLPVVTLLERRLESVVGIAATWFSQPVDGVIRAEAEYFIDEPAFRPERNVDLRALIPPGVRAALGAPAVPRTSIPKADYLRFVIGYDRFVFARWLNPTNSFVVTTSFNGSINTTERRGMDFRAPNLEPGRSPVVAGRVSGVAACNDLRTVPAALRMVCIATRPWDFEDARKFEGFLQTAVQTDYLHGKLEPRLVLIADPSGIFGCAPAATYRVSDSFLVTATYLAIVASREAGLGTFRDHDMVQLRLTYQLN